MDKKVIFAVAGSGKTRKIISELNSEERFLILTYTESNEENIRSRILDKFGHLPENIRLTTYFSFLYSFCYKPFLSLELNTKGLYWKSPPDYTSKLKHENLRHYISDGGLLYHNRLAKLLDKRNITSEIIKRFEKYFDYILIDEVQDFSGNDFNFLMNLGQAKTKILMVGDFHQHTYDTSRDGRINSTLHDDFEKYIARFKKAKIDVDLTSLLNSHRCAPKVCSYIEQNLGINIKSNRNSLEDVKEVIEKDEAERLYACNQTVKLFYQDHSKYECYSQNWGASKGEDHYGNVCVVLNKTTLEFYKDGNLKGLTAQTKNKLYVALSRARGEVYLVPEDLYAHRKHLKPRQPRMKKKW